MTPSAASLQDQLLAVAAARRSALAARETMAGGLATVPGRWCSTRPGDSSTVPGALSPRSAPPRVLHPGDVFCGERGERMETLLGSCISIVLTDPRRSFGVMSHIVHSGDRPSSSKVSNAHADQAFGTMRHLLTRRGLDASRCEAYVFGGGNMFPDLVSQMHVGERNARWAFDRLEQEGVRVVAADVCGTAYRRVRWTVGHDDPEVSSVSV